MKTANENIASALQHFALALALLAEADAKRIGGSKSTFITRSALIERHDHLLRIAHGIDRTAMLLERDEL